MFAVAAPLRGDDDTTDTKSVRQKIVTAIKESETPGKLATALDQIKEASAQQKLEAKLLFSMFRGVSDDVKVLGQQVAAIPKWNREDALYIHKPEQVQAVVHYLLALKARDAGDDKVFEAEMKETMWLWPTEDTFTKAVAEYQKMRTPVPMDVALPTSNGGNVTFAQAVKGQKALYIRVWATWCGPCLHFLPTLKARNKVLPPQGVAVMAMNTEMRMHGAPPGGNPAGAARISKEKNMGDMIWAVEPSDEPYSDLFDITSVPRTVVLSPDGHILFNGHPEDAKLKDVLAKLGVKDLPYLRDLPGGEDARQVSQHVFTPAAPLPSDWRSDHNARCADCARS